MAAALPLLATCSLLVDPSIGRRAALATVPAGIAALGGTREARALSPCPPGANNCLSTAAPSPVGKLATWKFPKGMDKAAAIDSLEKAGQADVDKGGWSRVDDKLASAGYARLEFRSGLGNMARFFNGGKPFVDDLELSVEDGFACIRSSSRVGDSDLGVNKKRVNFIAAALRSSGWDAPDVQ
ncbi:hypothetical protein EMIHUDRAFT_194356 [Emiliania huxleyi CCMP1516]|uniref:DUF1499 domain-containing protein n=2 Tax=Emiliania huxleyi TaxID=2903 RepID=A0A0D3L1D5_EMIH1|nr:hypothetical protein EMIHUDRAFT_194356 [Emiliania huxleyi CCMP1516]EOD41820.1 hypothetical protein EMIHUDRAFT_194356 [Emiliania huxleyi CCMP1516]|eukprot:XP_005794249.1 hypothetical protein EMIHUDRAFT_194356 [Emiliania huxleyi CCMP1516]